MLVYVCIYNYVMIMFVDDEVNIV